MRRIREVLRLKFDRGLNDAETARCAGIGRSTVQDYLHRIAATGVDPQQLKALGDEALDQRLFPPRAAGSSGRLLPDGEAVERDLRSRGVTLRLLWQEYLDTQPGGYQYTQFPSPSALNHPCRPVGPAQAGLPLAPFSARRLVSLITTPVTVLAAIQIAGLTDRGGALGTVRWRQLRSWSQTGSLSTQGSSEWALSAEAHNST